MEYWTSNPYRRPNSPFWHIVYEDSSGVVRRKSTRTRDVRIAREKLAETLREVELAKAGRSDPFAETRTRPIDELVQDYKATLESQRCAPRYTKNVIRMIRKFTSHAKVTTVASITVPHAIRFLEGVRNKLSARSRDHHAGALRSFGRWLQETGRWAHNPFQTVRVRTKNADRHRVFKRVGLRFAEAERLVEAAWARHEAERALGGVPATRDYDDCVRDRQTLYWTALTTALRAKELASVTWGDLTLDGDKPAVRLAGRFCKNGLDAMIPLQPFVVAALKQMRARRSAAQVRRDEGPVMERDPVFKMPDKLARLVRKDAVFAGLISERDPTANRLDFHALRKSCAIILVELGLHPRLIQATLRHASIELTMQVYAEMGETDLFRELPNRFPTPRMFATQDDGDQPPQMRAVP